MTTLTPRFFLAMSVLFVITIAAVFLFIATAMVPYWQEMTGSEVQDWFAGPFVRFSYMMVPVHFLSIASLVLTYVLYRKTHFKRTILVALIALLVCQAFNFALYGAVLNPALQSQELSSEVALATLDRWDLFHTIRTFFVAASALALLSTLVKIQGPATRIGAATPSD